MSVKETNNTASLGFVFLTIAWLAIDTIALGDYSQRIFPVEWTQSTKVLMTLIFSWFVSLGVIEFASEMFSSFKKTMKCHCDKTETKAADHV